VNGDDQSIACADLPPFAGNATLAALCVAVGPALESRATDCLDLNLSGIVGERHAGSSRLSDVRTPWYPRGTPIRNERQLSAVSQEELQVLADDLGIAAIEPAWLGANLAITGIGALSHLPRGSRLIFASGAVLVTTGPNEPCRAAGRALARRAGRRDLEWRFAAVAKERRGILACVEKAGRIARGDSIRWQVPRQRLWTPLPEQPRIGSSLDR